jgi:hypothetical protein
MTFDEMDSTLNLQQWIQQCVRTNPADLDTILDCPKGVEEGVWKVLTEIFQSLKFEF